MKKGTKIIGLILAVVLLMTATVFGTLAYLQATTDQLKNTFTVGKVEIALDEARTNTSGQPLDSNGTLVSDRKSAERYDGSTGKTGNEYHLVPGKVYTKDPTVTVDKDSEDSYVFVKVINNLEYKVNRTNKTLEAASDSSYSTISQQITGSPNSWTALTGVDNVYYKKFTNDPNATADTKWEVFTLFKISDDVTNDQFTEYTTNVQSADQVITIKAYAIQSEGFADAKTAWDAGKFS